MLVSLHSLLCIKADYSEVYRRSVNAEALPEMAWDIVFRNDSPLGNREANSRRWSAQPCYCVFKSRGAGFASILVKMMTPLSYRLPFQQMSFVAGPENNNSLFNICFQMFVMLLKHYFCVQSFLEWRSLEGSKSLLWPSLDESLSHFLHRIHWNA